MRRAACSTNGRKPLTKPTLGFDPKSVIATAKEIVDRGDIALDDLPTLALAEARVYGVLHEPLRPYAHLWTILPAGVLPDELGEVFRLAADLSVARSRLHSLRCTRHDERAENEA